MSLTEISDYEYYDGLSVAAAEIRDAIEQDFSQEAVGALKKVFDEKVKRK